MRMQIGDHFLATDSAQTYKIVGKWGGSWVLEPLDQDNDECLIYLAEEIEELVNSRKWLREAGCEK